MLKLPLDVTIVEKGLAKIRQDGYTVNMSLTSEGFRCMLRKYHTLDNRIELIIHVGEDLVTAYAGLIEKYEAIKTQRLAETAS